MTVWARGALTAADTETTSANPEDARVVEICLALIQPGQPTDVRTAVVNPGVEVPAEAAAIHGYTTERVRTEGKPAADVLDLFVDDMASSLRAGHPLLIMNAPYDLTVLDRDCRRNGVSTLSDRLNGPIAPVLDPGVLDKQILRYRRRVSPTQGARCLKTLAQVHGVGWDDEKAHGAEYDALQAARVLWRIGQRCTKPAGELQQLYGLRYQSDANMFRSLADMDLMALHEHQVGWYREQAESLGQYWRRAANEKRHEAGRDDIPDEQRDIALQEAAELDARIDGMSFDWPIRPLPQLAELEDPR